MSRITVEIITADAVLIIRTIVPAPYLSFY